jgi:hypothetical protein
MRPFADLTALLKSIEVFRWLCPDASPAASFALAIPGGSIVTTALTLLLLYVTPNLAFTVAGAGMAPRYQARTAVLLTLLGFVRSAWTHLYGNRIGPINCLHVSAETCRQLIGTTYIVWQNRRDRSKRAGAPIGEEAATTDH